MKLLILGGTRFLGRALVDSALGAGHEVSVFTRGISDAGDLPADVERLTGDRDGGMDALKGRSWDAVIDTSGYVPRIVRQSVELLADLTPFYAFVSSISVYSGLDRPGVNEESPVIELTDPSTEEVAQHYGGLKALCEREVMRVYPGASLIVRPGLIVGPRDPTDRFTYWPARLRRGGRVLAPGHPQAQVQIIDVRDLADWIVRMAEARRSGTYNASGPDRTLTMGELLEQCRSVLNPHAELQWADSSFLLGHDVGPWMEMPLWLPGEGGTEDVAHMMAADIGKAIRDGLTFRPLADTIRDTAEWDATRPGDTVRKAGMSADKEAELLARWSESAS